MEESHFNSDESLISKINQIFLLSYLMEQALNGSSGNHQYRLTDVLFHLWFEIYCIVIDHVFTIKHLFCSNVLRSSEKLKVFSLFSCLLSLDPVGIQVQLLTMALFRCIIQMFYS